MRTPQDLEAVIGKRSQARLNTALSNRVYLGHHHDFFSGTRVHTVHYYIVHTYIHLCGVGRMIVVSRLSSIVMMTPRVVISRRLRRLSGRWFLVDATTV